MALDPHSQALLDKFRQAGGTSIDDIDMEAARRDYDNLFTQLGGPVADDVVIWSAELDVPAPVLPVRVYRPSEMAEPAPTVLFLHGGGWCMGGLACYDALLSHLAAASGWQILSLAYRLAPEYPFPIPLDDALRATRALLTVGNRFGIDPGRLVLAGDSAGGTLASVVCAHLRRAAMRPLGQMLFYPVLCLLENDRRLASRQTFGNGDYFLSREGIAWAKGNYLTDPGLAVSPDVSPLLIPDLTGMPSALVITAGHDPLRDEGRIYAERLRGAGVAAVYADYPGTFHGFMSFIGALPVGHEAIRRAAEWLQER